MRHLLRLFRRRINSPAGLFNGPYFDVRTLYVLEFDRMPSISAIGELDGSRVHAFLRERFARDILRVWQHSYYEHRDRETVFSRTMFLLPGRRMIEVGADYCELLHDGDFGWANSLLSEMAALRVQPSASTIGFARSQQMN